jgi:plastocyanin
MTERRHRKLALALAVPLAAGLLGVPASGATKNVEVRDFEFAPPNVSVAVGSQVHWSRAVGATFQHNVHQAQGLFHSGAPTAGPIDLTRSFSSGTFRYLCQVHGGSGMRGAVRVPVTIRPDQAGGLPLLRWATDATNTGSRYDVQYRIGNGRWKNWKSDVRTRAAVFGKNGRPITLESGARYWFRARSQKPDGRPSGWSPARAYRHD